MADRRPPSAASSTGAQHRDGTFGVINDLRTTSVFSSLSKLFLNEKFSDMTIICRGQEFKAHRAIVCSQSSFFDRALTNGFSESGAGVVHLPEDDPEVVRLFLQFLYTGNYDDSVNPTWRMTAAMMSPEEITNALQRPPGVVVGSSQEVRDDVPEVQSQNNPDSAFRPEGAEASDSEGAESSDSEGAESSDSEGAESSESEGAESPEPSGYGSPQPEQEYNEFYGIDPDESSNVGRFREPLDSMVANRDPNRTDEDMLRDIAEFRHDHLLLSLRLYIMADKFDVLALRLLARDRFYRAAELQWRYDENFPDIIDELYNSTPDTEVAMREIVCRLVGQATRDEKMRTRMEPVMRRHGDFALGVLNYTLQLSSLSW